MAQAIIEASFFLLITAYIGFRLGRFIEQRKNRKLIADHEASSKLIDQLSFDLSYTKATRRTAQHELYMLRKRITQPAEQPPVTVDAGGKMIVPVEPKGEKEETAKRYEV